MEVGKAAPLTAGFFLVFIRWLQTTMKTSPIGNSTKCRDLGLHGERCFKLVCTSQPTTPLGRGGQPRQTVLPTHPPRGVGNRLPIGGSSLTLHGGPHSPKLDGNKRPHRQLAFGIPGTLEGAPPMLGTRKPLEPPLCSRHRILPLNGPWRSWELAEAGRRTGIDAGRQRLPCLQGWIVAGPDLNEFHDLLLRN